MIVALSFLLCGVEYSNERTMAKTIKLDCPMCMHHAFAYTASKGLGHCFVCGHTRFDSGYTGNRERIRSTRITEIREYYKQLAYYYHSNVDTAARDYLHRRGYTDDYISHNMIGYSPSGKNPIYNTSIAVESGLGTDSQKAVLDNRITFPYFYDDETIVDIRGRAIDKNATIRYKSPANDSYYRGADYAYNHRLLRNTNTIVITEGEIKADIPTIHDVPTIALPGMLSWKCGLETETDHKYVIVDDTQRDMQHVWKAIHKTAANLPNPYVGTLPLLGKEKMDIDTLIELTGVSLFHDVVNEALPYEQWKEFARF